jgi:hypothetical protein
MPHKVLQTLARMTPNTAMHLSRHRMAIFITQHTLRPGDGKR